MPRFDGIPVEDERKPRFGGQRVPEETAYVQPPAPPGFVLDPNTGQMVDVGRIAQEQSQGVLGQIGSFGGTAIRGIPFVGEYFDELIGQQAGPVAQGVARERVRQFEEQNPNVALAGQIGAGVSAALPAAVYGGPLVGAMAPTSLAGQSALGLGVGALAGGTEGVVSGYGAGTTPEERARLAQERGLTGTALGAGIGAAAPAITAGAGRLISGAQNLVQRLRPASEGVRAVQRTSIATTPREQVIRALVADDATGGARAAMRRAGPEAMLADAGPSSRKLLDAVVAESGPAAQIGREAVEQRAARAGQQVTRALDETLGGPQGIRSTAREIAERTAPARQRAYTAAYARPIDYAAASGRNIENVLERIPDRIKRGAIQRANEAMIAEGRRNQQILASIADDGTVTFTRPPNVEQLDYIKRALGEIGAEDIDQFGRRTATGNRAARLARELRDAVGDAVPQYNRAVQLGGDKIAEDNALALGQRLLRRGTTREQVAEAVQGYTRAERRAAAQGLRATIDEELSQVQRTITDGNIDAREATKAIKQFSSRANREKISLILGKENADRLLSRIDEAATSLDLRAAITENSKTFVRQETKRAIREATEAGPVQQLAAGRPLNAVQRVIQALTGTRPQDITARQDEFYAQIVRALTQPRGPEARLLFEGLTEMGRTATQNRAARERIARELTGTAALSGQQAGTRALTRNGAGPR